jgi:protein TonB
VDERPVAAAGFGGGAPGGTGEGRLSPPGVGFRVEPAYPEAARRAAAHGTALVAIAVRADGSVGEVRLMQSAGRDDLDGAAVDAVKKWRFAPAQRRGAAVDFCCIEIPFRFGLD